MIKTLLILTYVLKFYYFYKNTVESPLASLGFYLNM
jgi:hypothetical protein